MERDVAAAGSVSATGQPVREEMRYPDVSRGAVQGASLFVARTIGLQLVTGVATIALARLLAPRDYGAFSVALAVQQLGRAAVELGLPAALIRRPEPFDVSEQHAVTAFVLTGALTALALVGAVAFVLLPMLGAASIVLEVTAAACAALPFFALRLVPTVLLERELAFNRIVAIEVVETVGFYGFALAGAVAGLGPFSLAGAVPVAAIGGATMAAILRPWSFGVAWDLGKIRGLARFGAQAGALFPMQLLRDAAFMSTITALGGPVLAGFYSLALRLYSISNAMLFAVRRVGFNALSRIHAPGRRSATALRAAAAVTVATTLPVAVVATAANPIVDVLFGARWIAAADVARALAPGILLASGLMVLLEAWSLADGNATTPLTDVVVQIAVSIAAAAVLVPLWGAYGAGAAMSCGLLAGGIVLLVLRPVPPRLIGRLTAKALGIVALAWLVGRVAATGHGLPGLVVGLVFAVLAWTAGVAVLLRPEAAILLGTLRRHLRR